MNMGQVFARATDRYPESTALVDPTADVRYTYREWYDRAFAVAAALSERGIGEGDRIATAMRNRAELATLYCATQLLGAVFVPYNFRTSPTELAFLVNNVEPAALVFSEATADSVAAGREEFPNGTDLLALDETPSFAESYESYLDRRDPEFEPSFVDPDRTSLILHTGGTTGRPKGVPRSHRNTYAAAVAHAIQTSWSQREATLGLMSLAHTMGIHALAAVLVLGGKWVTQREFSAAATRDAIRSEGVTSLYLVPTVYHDLVESPSIADADVSSVRNVAFAGASMSTTDIRAVADQFEPESFVNHYGSTEVYSHAVCERLLEKPGCIGRAAINTRIRVVEPSEFGDLDPEARVDSGEVGEIIVDASSPEAFDGYLGADDDRTLVDGWFFTGDLGYRDADGDLFIIGRIDDMIISGGENIYPVEVESVLESHDLVREAAVVGRPSERWNQTVAAFVTVTAASGDVDFESAVAELDEHCRRSEGLANFKRPRKYFFIDELAKSNVGKILRKELQKKELDINVHAEVDV
ncbi:MULTISPECIES: class I adenylate-forming enzyme family protein [Halorussus]|uniref:class I adenylate-forming enzyme family protein n=1 Tax=Halorussus TaxID=1070314 RepID=UPI00209D47B3|nr:AMP-binding protein [Halorussus vallis]USZ77879.1 AMP-binding protein [Halorussus vallis]